MIGIRRICEGVFSELAGTLAVDHIGGDQRDLWRSIGGSIDALAQGLAVPVSEGFGEIGRR